MRRNGRKAGRAARTVPARVAVLASCITLIAIAIGPGTSSASANRGVLAPKGMPPSQVPTGNLAAAVQSIAGPNCGFGACYYYVGASQFTTATGASVVFTQAQPTVGVNDLHSLTEMAVESADGQQIVEVGWVVAEAVNGDSAPHLFVYHWVNGIPTCYNGCGFVASNVGMQAGGAVTVGRYGLFKILHANHRWTIMYDGLSVGYFPDSIWGGTFTNFGLVQVFGEVAASQTQPPKTEMGNGRFGSQPGSAVMAAFSLSGSSSARSLTHYVIGSDAYYDDGLLNTLVTRYGGPGS